MAVSRLRLAGVVRSFGATRALRGVDFELAPGEVHALIGENGAGKSTLIKIVGGILRADAGVVELDGKPYRPANPLSARRRGIAVIHQELSLAPDLSVEENVLLGREPRRFGFVATGQRRRQARQALAQLGREAMDLRRPVRELGLAEQQMVEIARALVDRPRALLMDEPTSSLTRLDTQRLFEAISRLKQAGVSVIYVSHFLEECRQVADRYTVLRDGRSVATGEMSRVTFGELVRAMAGEDSGEFRRRTERPPGDVVFELDRICGKTLPREVSLSLRRGEILGIAGLVGAGRTETLRVCFGLDALRGGRLRVKGRWDRGRSPRGRLRQGVGYVSESRKEEGLLLERSLADNLTLTRLEPCSRWGFIDRSAQNRAASRWIDELSVSAAGPRQSVRELSGGNQQKIAIGRLLHHEADILLLDEPTRGIDVGSRFRIYRLIHELAEQGRAVLLASSYLPELLGICDRIAVMRRGELVAVHPVADWNESRLLAAAAGEGNETHES